MDTSNTQELITIPFTCSLCGEVEYLLVPKANKDEVYDFPHECFECYSKM